MPAPNGAFHLSTPQQTSVPSSDGPFPLLAINNAPFETTPVKRKLAERRRALSGLNVTVFQPSRAPGSPPGAAVLSRHGRGIASKHL